VYDLNKDIT